MGNIDGAVDLNTKETYEKRAFGQPFPEGMRQGYARRTHDVI